MLNVKPHIKELIPYNPGKPIEELERERGIKAIKLASNENPLGPSPMAVKAIIDAASGVHRYPDGGCFYLKRKMSEFLGIDPDNLIFGNGSNEIIELLARTFLSEGDIIVYGCPSFVVYRLISKAMGLSSVEVPLNADLKYDLGRMAEVINGTDGVKMVFIANPNNPTGTMVEKKEVEDFIRSVPDDVMLVFDEAYYEFAERDKFPDLIPLAVSKDNIVVMRTFSKAYGLAGLRIGYAVASKSVVDLLNRVRQPFNVNSLAQAAACAALDDMEHVKKTVELVSNGKRYIYSELDRLGIEYVPSSANFVLVKVGNSKEVFERLLDKGVIVRAMDGYSLSEYIRVTIGTEKENELFIKALKEVLNL